MDSPDIIALTETVQRALHRLPIVAVYLFGSRARGENRPDSDFDFGVLTEGGVNRLDLEDAREALELALNADVDLAHLNNASTVLQHEVLLDGVRLLAPAALQADMWELRVMSEYQDHRIRSADLMADIFARGRVIGS